MSPEAVWPAVEQNYADARDALIEAEHTVTRAIEDLAAQRRDLPSGSVVGAYRFEVGSDDLGADDEQRVEQLLDLFGEHRTLMLYNFMFDGSTDTPCAMCTSLIDGFDGVASDLGHRVALGVVAPAPLRKLRDYGRERGWRNVRLVADVDGHYSRDSGGLSQSGDLASLMTVFTRHEDEVRHFYTSLKPPTDRGQDDRHLDSVWPLWGLLDLTPEGRGDWRPSRAPRR